MEGKVALVLDGGDSIIFGLKIWRGPLDTQNTRNILQQRKKKYNIYILIFLLKLINIKFQYYTCKQNIGNFSILYIS